MRRRFSALVVAAMVATATPALTTSAAAQTATDSVVISQVYGGGGNSGAPYTHDFVELRNIGSTSVDLSELSVQYASATGTGNFAPTGLSGTLEPGQFHLLRLASGAAGEPLPVEPDDTGTLNLAGASGKVALASGTTSLGCNGGSTPCDADATARIIDLVGYGAANYFEGSGAAPTLSASLAAFRADDGCTDTDDNAADFTAAFPAPRNSSTAAGLCPGATLTTQVLANPSFEEPGQNGVVPDAWSSTLFEGETSPFGGGTDFLAFSATGQFPPPAEVPDGEFAARVRYGVGPNQGVIGYGFEQGSDAFSTTVDQDADATLSYAIAEAAVSSLASLGWAGSFIEVEATSDDENEDVVRLRYYHPASVELPGAGPSDTDDTVYVVGADLERDEFVAAEQDVTGDLSDAFPELGDHTVTAVRGGVLQDRTGGGFTNMTTWFDDLRLEATGVNQPILASCEDLALEFGSAGSVTLSATDADGTVVDATLGDAPAGVTLDDVVPATEVGGTLTGTLVAPDDLALGTYPVAITFTNDDEPTPQTTTCTVNISVSPAPGTIIPINEIQGPGSSTPIPGVTVTTEAVVTADHTGDEDGNQLGGFFMESEADLRDDDPATSEGIFVFAGSAAGDLEIEVGDLVQVTGTAGESFGQTQLTVSAAADVEVVGDGTLPPPAEIEDLPPYVNESGEPTDALRNAFFEPLEGMRVVLADTWTVTDNGNLQFGELELVPGTQPLQNFTNVGEPGPEAGAFEFANNNNNRRWTSLTLDDTRDGNLLTAGIDLPYLDENGTVRRGSTLEDQEAILSYGFNRYRLRPVTEDAVDIDHAPRPGVPDVGGDVTVAAFNVLNYFNGNGDGTGFPTARGASTFEDFEQQSAKIEEAILAFDADVVGLIEVENDVFGPNAAVTDLVERLNDRADDEDLYAVATTPDADGNVGTDAIAVKFIYQPETVSFDGYELDDTVPFGTASRVPVAARFTENATDESFVAVNNHFKSKGSGSGENADQGDGQAASNLDRIRSSQNLLDWFEEDAFFDQDEPILIIGDLNAYANEDPIVLLEENGFTDLLEVYEGDRAAYTYTFFGAEGRLDHALGNDAALDVVTGAEAWNINADEPRLLEYGQALAVEDEFRSSDHDPVLVGLDLAPDVVDPVAPTVDDLALSTSAGVAVNGQLVITNPDGGPLTVAYGTPGNGVVTGDNAGAFTYTPAAGFAGTDTFTVTVTDEGGLSDTATVTITVQPTTVDPPDEDTFLECPPGTGSGFPDVGASSVHADNIRCGNALGLLEGLRDGRFNPLGSLTRGQAATVIDRIANETGRPIVGDRRSFSDVPASGYVHGDAIERLAGAGVILGFTDGTFRPNAPVTRGQLATLLVRYIESTTGEQLPLGQRFPDVQAGTELDTVLRKAQAAGIFNGTESGEAQPQRTIRRDQAASLFVRSLESLPVAD
jgi:predicted extracellular nuclease